MARLNIIIGSVKVSIQIVQKESTSSLPTVIVNAYFISDSRIMMINLKLICGSFNYLYFDWYRDSDSEIRQRW